MSAKAGIREQNKERYMAALDDMNVVRECFLGQSVWKRIQPPGVQKVSEEAETRGSVLHKEYSRLWQVL